jgi:hypothetical protein
VTLPAVARRSDPQAPRADARSRAPARDLGADGTVPEGVDLHRFDTWRSTRASGPCEFCLNAKWKFPKGCPYGKPDEKKYDIGFLEKVAGAMLKGSGEHVVMT